jgi:hypothetical protein
LRVDRDVVDLGVDAAFAQARVERRPVHAGARRVRPHHVQVPGRQRVRVLPGQDEWQGREQAIVTRRECTAALEEVGQACHLARAERGLEISHAVVEA